MSEYPDQFQWKAGYTPDDGVQLVHEIKAYLNYLSYERHPRADQVPSDPLPYPLPSHFKVAYNGAWGLQIRKSSQRKPRSRSLQLTNPSLWFSVGT